MINISQAGNTYKVDLFRNSTGCGCAPVVQYEAHSNEPADRIMGGFEALPNKLPYQVLIKVKRLLNILSYSNSKVNTDFKH